LDPKLQRTPLYDRHVALGAKMVDFAGWAMPVQYDGLVAEHRRVRGAAGLFDVSHMGELLLTGPGALATVDTLATNDCTALADGQVLYTALCNREGGIRDDALVYRAAADRFMIVVNAANTAKIVDWTGAHLQPATQFRDISNDVALIAVQGPQSAALLARCRTLGAFGERADKLDYYWFIDGEADGKPLTISRTGYTGEKGFELFVAPERAGAVWDELLSRGRDLGAGPAGLGARDTLRFEVCFSLYGHELGEDVSPFEAGIGWTVKLKKPAFIGRDALRAQRQAGVPRKLVGFEIPAADRAIARQGYVVLAGGRAVGRVTSGTWAPTLEKSLGLALVETAAATSPLAVVIRNRTVAVETVPIPFHEPVARQ
jgi:aminomethyltransferase